MIILQILATVLVVAVPTLVGTLLYHYFRTFKYVEGGRVRMAVREALGNLLLVGQIIAMVAAFLAAIVVALLLVGSVAHFIWGVPWERLMQVGS